MNHLNRAKFRVKIKSLAAEAAIIRQAEQKAVKHLRAVDALEAPEGEPIVSPWRQQQRLDHQEAAECLGGLHAHRVHQVRDEARATFLAYAYCRGKERMHVERKSVTPVDVKRVVAICRSLGDRLVLPMDIAEWATKYYAPVGA